MSAGEDKSYRSMRSWLRGLLPWEVRQQAERRAQETGRSVGQILHAWASNDYITRRVRQQAEDETL